MTKAKGNMYIDVTHTHNDIKGKCFHNCSYCYMDSIRKRYNQKEKEPYLDEKELSKNLGCGNIIFIGSSTDMWAKNIPDEWIYKVLEHVKKNLKTLIYSRQKTPPDIKTLTLIYLIIVILALLLKLTGNTVIWDTHPARKKGR